MYINPWFYTAAVVIIGAIIWGLIRLLNKTRQLYAESSTNLRDTMEAFSFVAFRLTGTRMQHQPSWEASEVVEHIRDCITDRNVEYGDIHWPTSLLTNVRGHVQQIEAVLRLQKHLDGIAVENGEPVENPAKFERIHEFVSELKVDYGFFNETRESIDEKIVLCAKRWQDYLIAQGEMHQREADTHLQLAKECGERYPTTSEVMK